MERIGIIGGGISGLSFAYYLQKYLPHLPIVLYESNKPGGYMQTVQQDEFQFETGPRSMRLSPRCISILDIAYDIGLTEEDVTFSSTSSLDAMLFFNGKLTPLFPQGKARVLRGLIQNPFFLRTFLANFLFKRRASPVEDESMREFIEKNYRFMSSEDKGKMLVFLDALQTGIYGGDIDLLSARHCAPIAPLFRKKYSLESPNENELITDSKGSILYKTGKQGNSNALNFRFGLSSFIKQLLEFLMKNPNFKYRNSEVMGISKQIIETENSTESYSKIISTVPSYVLAKLLHNNPTLSETLDSIPHNSMRTINLGFPAPLPLTGVGYLIPSKENTALSGSLFDSSQFPTLQPSVSLMAVLRSSPAPAETMISEFYRHTGLSMCYTSILQTDWFKSVPQYTVNHHKKIQLIESSSPDWLVPSGHSIYLSGIPNCVATSRQQATELAIKCEA